MGDSPEFDVGSIGWMDLTVVNAEQVRAFYEAVVGWKNTPLDMGGYKDFCMLDPTGTKTIAGICHARGVNADMPHQWLLYITVPDLQQSVGRCVSMGGRVIAGPKTAGSMGKYCVIQDPAGAVAALLEVEKK